MPRLMWIPSPLLVTSMLLSPSSSKVLCVCVQCVGVGCCVCAFFVHVGVQVCVRVLCVVAIKRVVCVAVVCVAVVCVAAMKRAA